MNSKKKCSLLMSCHSVINPEDSLPLETGVYGEGSLVVVSSLGNNPLIRIPDILDLIWDKEVEETFLYLAGLGSSVDTLEKECKSETTMKLLKIALECTKRENIHLVGCSCNLQKKEHFAKAEGLDFIESGEDCGGSSTLGEIAAKILKKSAV